MKAKQFDTVKMKRKLQKASEEKLTRLSEKGQLDFLSKKFGHLKKHKKTSHVA